MADMLISLETIKRHLRLDMDPDSELDPELERLYEAALDYASNYLGRPIPWSIENDSASSSSETMVFPKSVEQAILILIAEYFENREQNLVGTITAELPTVTRLLHFYRVGLGV